MSEIHGRLPDGTWVRGVEVFRELYAAIGWTPVVWISRLPLISGLLDRAYRLFARNRLRWTRRCVPGSTICKRDKRQPDDPPVIAQSEEGHAVHS
jgi:predicted DCC family thiol-disulfide oxidoreductase YuxK